jgi:hypothetical protein
VEFGGEQPAPEGRKRSYRFTKSLKGPFTN